MHILHNLKARLEDVSPCEDTLSKLCERVRSCVEQFLRAQYVVLSAYTIAIVILSVRLSVRLSRPGADSSTGEIETPGFYHMIA